MASKLRYGTDPITGAERINDAPIDFAERGPQDDPAGPLHRITVEHDTLIDRPDLGSGSTTLVNAGDHIPIELEAYPRHPA